MEINPRLGGGVIASIEAGHNIPEMLISDILDYDVKKSISNTKLIMKRYFEEIFMKIIVDLDGTICTEEKQFSRSLAKVNPGAREALNLLKEKGFILIIYSARTWAEYELTIDWLKKIKFLLTNLFLVSLKVIIGLMIVL